MSDDKIDRNDIRDQIAGIGEGVTHQAEEAKTQIVAVGAGICLPAPILFLFLGRKKGLERSALIQHRPS